MSNFRKISQKMEASKHEFKAKKITEKEYNAVVKAMKHAKEHNAKIETTYGEYKRDSEVYKKRWSVAEKYRVKAVEQKKKINKKVWHYSFDAGMNLLDSSASMVFGVRGIGKVVKDGLVLVPGALAAMPAEAAAVKSVIDTYILSGFSAVFTSLGWVGAALGVFGIAYEGIGIVRNQKMIQKIDNILGAKPKDKAYSDESCGYEIDNVIEVLEYLTEVSEYTPRKLAKCGITKAYIDRIPEVARLMQSGHPGDAAIGELKARVLVENVRARLGKQRTFKVVSVIVSAVGLVALGVALSPLAIHPAVLGTAFLALALIGVGLIIWKLTAFRDPIDPTRVKWVPKGMDYDTFINALWAKNMRKGTATVAGGKQKNLEDLSKEFMEKQKKKIEARAKRFGKKAGKAKAREENLARLERIEERINSFANLPTISSPIAYKV